MLVFGRRQVSLSCLVYGETEYEIFSVEIRQNDSVADLKNEIFKAREDIFGNHDVTEFILWRVNHPANNIGTIVLQQGSPKSVKMNPGLTFKNYILLSLPLDSDNVHIVIEGPGTLERLTIPAAFGGALTGSETIFKVKSETDFHLDDLNANNIIHDFQMPANNRCTIAITAINNLSAPARALHTELWQTRYFRSDGDQYYNTTIARLQTLLTANGVNPTTYFAAQPLGYAGPARLVDLEEAMNYVDLLDNFKNMVQRTRGKTDLCKCAAMHNHIVDRPLQRSTLNYNRGVGWHGKEGNICVFVTEDNKRYKYDPVFDLRVAHAYPNQSNSFPIFLLEEKPETNDSRCNQDRLLLAMMAKAGEALMYLQTAVRSVILAIFINDNTYEVYYGFSDPNPDPLIAQMAFFFRCVSITQVNGPLQAFQHAFMLYNFSEHVPPTSALNPNDFATVQATIAEYSNKRNLMPTMNSESKKQKTGGEGGDGGRSGNSGNRTNFRHRIIDILLDSGYDVKMPPDFDDTDVLIPLSWSPDIAFGSRIVDDLPIVAKLASKLEATIVKELNNGKQRAPTNHTVPLLDVVCVDFDEILIMANYNNLYETTPQSSDDVIQFTKQLVEGVQFLHQKGIVHNDIALRNVVVCPKSKKLYIIDFGEAEYLQANTENKVKEELQRLGSTILKMAKKFPLTKIISIGNQLRGDSPSVTDALTVLDRLDGSATEKEITTLKSRSKGRAKRRSGPKT